MISSILRQQRLQVYQVCASSRGLPLLGPRSVSGLSRRFLSSDVTSNQAHESRLVGDAEVADAVRHGLQAIETGDVLRKREGVLTSRGAPKHDFDLGKFSVVLVGRPNVGKSTIYNRMVSKRDAIVSAVPGTTRDRKEGEGALGGLDFILCDTGGFENIAQKKRQRPTELLAPMHGTELVDAMHFQMSQAIHRADVVMMVVDAQEGISPEDVELARWVRRQVRTSHGIRDENGTVLSTGFVLLANKSEGRGEAFSWAVDGDQHWRQFLVDCYKLTFGEPIPVSAEHGQGFGDVHNALLPFAIESGVKAKLAREKFIASNSAENLAEEAILVSEVAANEAPATGAKLVRRMEERRDALHIAIVGRPNVGKSTLVNTIIGEQRCIAGPMPGLTRDAIAIDWEYNDRRLRLVDTAGIRSRTRLFGASGARAEAEARKRVNTDLRLGKTNKLDANLEDLSIQSSLRALDRSSVVIVVIDVMAQARDPESTGPLSKHDLEIIRRVLDEGRGLVVAANKCDLAEAHIAATNANMDVIEFVRNHVEAAIPMASGIPVVPMSALEGVGVNELLPTVIETYDRWRSRIPTHKLNEWLAMAQMQQRPPASKGVKVKDGRMRSGPLKIKYITQASTRPPTFVAFVNRMKAKSSILPDSYKRFLQNSITKHFGMGGVPLRITVRGNDEKGRRPKPPRKSPGAQKPGESPSKEKPGK